MRNLGILEYDEALSNMVDNKIQIEENSKYEVEIRANMIAVIDYLYNELDKKVSRIDINDFIWLKGKHKNENDKPYHLTRTINY
jgi:hypothetical protein